MMTRLRLRTVGLPEGVMTPEELENMGIKLGNVEAPEDRDEL